MKADDYSLVGGRKSNYHGLTTTASLDASIVPT